MFYMRLAVLVILGTLPVYCAAPDLVLKKYSGSWQVVRKSAPANKEELKIQCALAGSFYACQHSSHGAVSGLLVFAPTNDPNRFNTQYVMPDARATGKGDLRIDGDRWVLTNTWNSGSGTSRSRTTYTFTGANKMEFTQEESTDGQHWQSKDSGEQVRIAR
jgi:hypothetical protein